MPETWSESLKEAVKAEELGVVDYELLLDYNYWNYCMWRLLAYRWVRLLTDHR